MKIYCHVCRSKHRSRWITHGHPVFLSTDSMCSESNPIWIIPLLSNVDVNQCVCFFWIRGGKSWISIQSANLDSALNLKSTLVNGVQPIFIHFSVCPYPTNCRNWTLFLSPCVSLCRRASVCVWMWSFWFLLGRSHGTVSTIMLKIHSLNHLKRYHFKLAVRHRRACFTNVFSLFPSISLVLFGLSAFSLFS